MSNINNQQQIIKLTIVLKIYCPKPPHLKKESKIFKLLDNSIQNFWSFDVTDGRSEEMRLFSSNHCRPNQNWLNSIYVFFYSFKCAFNTDNMLNDLSDLTWPNCHVVFYALQLLSTWQTTDTCLRWVTEDKKKKKSMCEWNMRWSLDNQSCFKWYRTFTWTLETKHLLSS